MNMLQFIIYASLYFIFLFVLIIYTIIWMKKNDTLINASIDIDGVLLNKTYRGRFFKDKFYTVRQFWIRQRTKLVLPSLSYTKFKDYIMINEGVPLISPKKILNVLQYKTGMIPWLVPSINTIKSINNIRIVKLRKIRKELWDSTDNTTKADVLIKLAIPAMMVILAIAVCIFFPKMYEKIMSYTQPALEEATKGWIESLRSFKKPLG